MQSDVGHHPFRKQAAMQTVKAGVLYFAVMFAVGFAFGTIRVLWVVPRVGVRTAELLESPLMLAVTILAATWVMRRLRVPPALWERLTVGLVAVALLLMAEFGLVRALRGLTIREYFASRDPVSGTVYIVMLAIFAVMPALVARA
jgi:hypothetical protein